MRYVTRWSSSGAILSPQFFSLYINDVVTSAEGEFNLFADDTLVYVLENSPSALQIKLQSVLNSLSVWFKSWAVAINPKKSALMVLSRNRNVPFYLWISMASLSLKFRHINILVWFSTKGSLGRIILIMSSRSPRRRLAYFVVYAGGCLVSCCGRCI